MIRYRKETLCHIVKPESKTNRDIRDVKNKSDIQEDKYEKTF